MTTKLQTLAFVGALAISSALTIGVTSARAQDYAPGGSPAYYYPGAGYYGTTAGTVYIPAPGYYYNVPAQQAAPTSYGFAPATRPGWSYSSGYQPSPGYGVRRGGWNPNNPAYYSGAVHSLHGRGWDSGQHGR